MVLTFFSVILAPKNCNIFFLDDDLQYTGYVERSREKYKVKKIKEEGIIYNEIYKIFDIMILIN